MKNRFVTEPSKYGRQVRDRKTGRIKAPHLSEHNAQDIRRALEMYHGTCEWVFDGGESWCTECGGFVTDEAIRDGRCHNCGKRVVVKEQA